MEKNQVRGLLVKLMLQDRDPYLILSAAFKIDGLMRIAREDAKTIMSMIFVAQSVDLIREKWKMNQIKQAKS